MTDSRNSERFQNELELVGAILSTADPMDYQASADIVMPEHFSDPMLARTYGLIGRNIGQGHRGYPLVKSVINDLVGDVTWAEIKMTPSGLVAKCLANAAPRIALEATARQLKKDYLHQMMTEATEAGRHGEVEDCAAEIQKINVAHQNRDDGFSQLSASANDVVEAINRAYQEQIKPENGAYCGSYDLNRLFGGWKPGKFYVIGGRPGMGKSTTALSWLLRTAKSGHGVMMFSLEMTKKEITEMALCDIAWSRKERIEYRKIANVDPEDKDLPRTIERLAEATEIFQNMPMAVMDRPGLTLAEIKSYAIKQRQVFEAVGKKLEVIVIDHLGLIRASKTYSGNKVAETEELSAGLKVLAKELKLAIICLVQLNRGVEGRDDKQPSLSDLRWSGAIEQDADVVAFVYREAYYLQKSDSDPNKEAIRVTKLDAVRNELKLIVAKNRGGPTPSMTFFCDIGCAVVRDIGERRG